MKNKETMQKKWWRQRQDDLFALHRRLIEDAELSREHDEVCEKYPEFAKLFYDLQELANGTRSLDEIAEGAMDSRLMPELRRNRISLQLIAQ